MSSRIPILVCLSLSVNAAAAQNASFWLELNGAHSRPPAGRDVDPSNYGLIGGRMRVAGRGSAFELGAIHGRGVQAGSGGWLSGRASLETSRVHGALDIGLNAEGTGLTYLTPVRLGADDYTQSLVSGTVRPFGGLSVAGFRLGLEGALTLGAWRSEVSRTVVDEAPGFPLPAPDRINRQTINDDGNVSIAGGAASLMRVFGPATLEVRAGSYRVENQVANGRYTGLDGTLALALGPLDLALGARRWHTPVAGAELGGHAALGFGLGDRAYVQAIASRSISDPTYGAAGSIGVTVGLRLRVGGAALGGPPAARVLAPSGRGRVVRFTLEHKAARSVAVAGDFSGWEQRALRHDDHGVWTLDTVLDPGVYHFSFVIDGETWMVPDDAPGIIDDGFGRKNATLIVNGSNEKAVQ